MHWYEAVAVPGGIDWEAANWAAHAAGGHLVTIASLDENAFVFSLISHPEYWQQGDGPWIGGLQALASTEPLGGWRWTEPELISFQVWTANQPDDNNGADRMHFGGAQTPVAGWADSPAGRKLPGYVIERAGPTVPRTVGVVHSESGVSEGYTLLAPINATGTYLIDDRGRLVNSWSGTAIPGMSVYLLPNGNLLRASRSGNTTFTVGGAGGSIEEYDWHGKLVWSYAYSSSTFCQHHDVARLPNGNTLLIAWEYKSQAEALAAGRDPSMLTSGVLYPDAIIEVQPTGPNSGKVVWEWHVWDHLIQDRDPTKANFGPVGQHPERVDVNYPPLGRLGGGIHDWMHSNSVAYNAALDQIVLSVRHFNEFWVIDHSTTTEEAASSNGGRSGKGGDLLYRWGNPEAYRAGTAADRRLFQQHDADWIQDGLPGAGNFLVFDNGVERPEHLYSTVLEVVPPRTDATGNYPRHGTAWGPTQAVWSYEDPGSFFSQFVGGAQRLPNGNTLVCAGWQSKSFEVTTQGRVVWRYASPFGNFGPSKQGSTEQGGGFFRSPWYPPRYPAFIGRDLTPKAPIEQQGTVLLVEGSSANHRARIGTAVSLSLRAANEPGSMFIAGTSMTAGMIGYDHRYLRVGWDPVLMASVQGALPMVFRNYAGTLDAQGAATATFVIPNYTLLIGSVFHTTFAVLDPNSSSGLGIMANRVVITVDG